MSEKTKKVFIEPKEFLIFYKECQGDLGQYRRHPDAYSKDYDTAKKKMVEHGWREKVDRLNREKFELDNDVMYTENLFARKAFSDTAKHRYKQLAKLIDKIDECKEQFLEEEVNKVKLLREQAESDGSDPSKIPEFNFIKSKFFKNYVSSFKDLVKMEEDAQKRFLEANGSCVERKFLTELADLNIDMALKKVMSILFDSVKKQRISESTFKFLGTQMMKEITFSDIITDTDKLRDHSKSFLTSK